MAGLATAATAQPVFEAERIRAHVRELADDRFEGRAPGQPGGQLTEETLAREFASCGLEPAGENGTFFQAVPLVGVTTESGSRVSLECEGEPWSLLPGQDIVLNNPRQQREADIDAPIVFVGLGIHSPQTGWDDYAGADLHGKVALCFVNEPPSDRPDFFLGKALTYSGRWTYKLEESARQGAVATLIIHRTDLASYGWEVVRNSWSGEQCYLREEQRPRVQMAAWIQQGVARKLVGEAGYDLDELYAEAARPGFRAIPLRARLKAHVVSRVRPFSARNVIGRRPGTGPGALLYTAHHDHLGRDESVAGPDKIYNGALDNASGCAVLLELARQFPTVGRSVYFVATTAEEQGLLGAAYLALHPPVPAEQISLDLNFDMLPALGQPLEISAPGSERTDFYPVVQQVAEEMNLKLRPDPHPEAGLYYRMDHFRLAQQGIPAFTISEGLLYEGKSREWCESQMREYVARRYHQPSDEFVPEWDFSGLATVARFAYELGIRAANQAPVVKWNPGDEFSRR